MPRYTPEQLVDILWGPPPSGAGRRLEDLRRAVPAPEKPPGETVFVERTAEGREIRLDLLAALQASTEFYNHHNLEEFAQALPKEISLSPPSEAKLREALRQGFDQAIFLPGAELQTQTVDTLIDKLASEPVAGLPEAEQYTEPYIFQPEVTKAAAPRNRPAGKAYLLLYQSGPLPPETKNQTYPALDQLFAEKGWNGLTLEEYLLLQRQECEARKDHSFDAYSDDATKSQLTWLLDSRVPSGVVNAYWDPANRRVQVRWGGPEYANPLLGARPAVVVEL